MEAMDALKVIVDEIPVVRLKVYPKCPNCGREWAVDIELWKTGSISENAYICRSCGYNATEQRREANP